MTATAYWAAADDDVATSLDVALRGLRSADAAKRLARFGPNEIQQRTSMTRLRVQWRQVRSPLVLLLVFAALASAASGEWIDAATVGAILAASVGSGFVAFRCTSSRSSPAAATELHHPTAPGPLARARRKRPVTSATPAAADRAAR